MSDRFLMFGRLSYNYVEKVKCVNVNITTENEI